MIPYEGERRVNLNDLLSLGFEDFGDIKVSLNLGIRIKNGETNIITYGHEDIGYTKILAFYPVCWIGGKPDMTSIQLRIYDRSSERWEDYIKSPRHLRNWYIYETGKRI